MVVRREPRKKVCARVALDTLLGGRSSAALEGLFRRGAGLSARAHSDSRLEEPFVSAAIGSVASVAELHCLMNRSGITVTVAAADAGVAPLGGREHCALAASFVAGFRFEVGAARRRAVRQCQATWVALFGGGGSPSNNHWSGP